MVHFELPANELTRIFSRLEHLEQKARYFLKGENPWDSRSAVEAIMDILHLLDRPDLRNKLTQEVNRIQINLQRLQGTPQIDQEKCGSLLIQLDNLYRMLLNQNGKFAESLRQIEFIKTSTFHHLAPGGVCEYHLPEFQSWLAAPFEERQADLTYWLSAFKDVFQVRELLLSLFRDSAVSSDLIAKEGFYQSALDPQSACQLIRVSVSEQDLYPLMSLGRHGISIRFLQRRANEKALQTKENIAFHLFLSVF